MPGMQQKLGLVRSKQCDWFQSVIKVSMSILYRRPYRRTSRNCKYQCTYEILNTKKMQHDLETTLQGRRRSFFMCLLVMYCVLTTSSVEHTFEIEENILLHFKFDGKAFHKTVC